jgi:hypothetical protein
MESRADMLARHARELAELDAKWWIDYFTEDPCSEWIKLSGICEWIREKLPTIIRKREKIGVCLGRHSGGFSSSGDYYLSVGNVYCGGVHPIIANQLAGRTLAPGERVEL